MKVYHRIKPDFFAEIKPDAGLEDYKLVATVDCDDLEKVFELTNHIDGDWAMNENVIAYDKNNRSTNMGDVIMDDNGTIWWRKAVGWEKV